MRTAPKRSPSHFRRATMLRKQFSKMSAFPTRPNGQIPLGSIKVQAESGKGIAFEAGPTSVSFSASAGLKTGLGVFDKSAGAIASLQLQNTPHLDLALDEVGNQRYLLMLWGYNIAGSFSGSHPIGALGSVTFGAEGSRDALYAVLHRFPRRTGARTAIDDTVSSWRLPRQLAGRGARNFKPGTWLIAEVDGSIALKVSARLGYDFNFVRELKLLGIDHQLGAKIDAGVKATLGFSASGRYVVVLGRESERKNPQSFACGLQTGQKGMEFRPQPLGWCGQPIRSSGRHG